MSQTKLDECGHVVIENHGNYSYDKINTDRTMMNMDWTYIKRLDVGIHTSEWFVAVFPLWVYREIPNKFA